MKQAQLGSVETTSIGLGTAPLGGLFAPVSDLDADATIEQAWSLGVRFFDTAPLYGFGLAQRRLGSFLRHRSASRLRSPPRWGDCCVQPTVRRRKTITTRARHASADIRFQP